MPVAKRKICVSCGVVHQRKSETCFRCERNEKINHFVASGKGHCAMCGKRVPDNRIFVSRYCSSECSFESVSQSVKATNIVKSAIKRGVMKPISEETTCVDCGKPAHDYDHRDYNKPLDVDPVCRGCNIRRGPAIHTDRA